ncbi:MAG: hypothetical protein ABL958_15460, partial [Bdellovibrionia bacterium]
PSGSSSQNDWGHASKHMKRILRDLLSNLTAGILTIIVGVSGLLGSSLLNSAYADEPCTHQFLPIVTEQRNPIAFSIGAGAEQAHFCIPEPYLHPIRYSMVGFAKFVSMVGGIHPQENDWRPWRDAYSDVNVDDPNEIKLMIDVREQRSFAPANNWATRLKDLAPLGETFSDLMAYRQILPPQPEGSIWSKSATVFVPKIIEKANFVAFQCMINSRGNLTFCTGRTSFSEFVNVAYTFSATELANWRRIDDRVRTIIAAIKTG